MPGRTPAEAVHNYLEPLQQSISCFGREVLRTTRGAAPGVEQLAVLGVDFPVLELLTSKDEKLALSFIQGFVLEQTPDGDWKVRTTSYLYGIEDTAGNEILAFHWHPNSDASPVPYPHLHIGYGAGRDLRDEVASIHFRTDRMGFEDLGLMLLQDFRVLPERDDAVAVLTRNLEIFRRYRSWASVTE